MHTMQIPICIILWSSELMTMKSIVRNVTPCVFIRTNYSEKPTANKFRAKDVSRNRTSTVDPKTGHEDPQGEYRYSSTPSLTSPIDGNGWSKPRPGRSTSGRARWDKGRSGRVRKISPPPEFNTQTVQPVASRYIEWATLAHIGRCDKFKIKF